MTSVYVHSRSNMSLFNVYPAIEILQEDPNLSKIKNNIIQKTYAEISKTTGVWSNIS